MDSTAPPSKLEQQLREMNEALLVSSVKQHELTEQAQKAEAALRASEVRYRRLFESAKDGILILDAHTGKITDANACMGGLMGTESHELLGKELFEIGLASDKSANEAAVRELQEKGYIRYQHLPMQTNRGQHIEVEVVANVYTEDHQSVIQCNIRDISERSRLERLTQEQAAELSDLHRRKDEFLAMLSHELRNPLATITNAAHMLGLERGSESLIQQQARGIIERQLGQLQHLVDDLLEVSRITTGRVQLRRERVAVSGIVEVAVETVRPLLEQRRHDLTVSLPPEPILLHADAARLEQVVVNLLTNAAKYTEEGGHVWLTVQLEGDECVLRVRDTGVGIPPELLPRIFDLFTQAERSLDRSQGGLGIGLALVQRLTELHGGKVEAYSALRQGSEFVVRLPAVTTPRKTSDVPETSEVSGVPAAMRPAEPRRAGTTGRVLMVDDSVDFVDSMAIMLCESGYDVRTAHTGPAALEAAIAFEPEVMLLDIGLPEMNGYEVARHLREHSKLKNVRLVALTGYGQESDVRRAEAAGFDLHLVKPVGFQRLQDLLTTLLTTPAKSLGN